MLGDVCMLIEHSMVTTEHINAMVHDVTSSPVMCTFL